jgi:aspartate/methionine/tyrosine aminotransferase
MHESRRLSAVQSPIIPVIADLIRAHPGTISLGQGVVNYAPPPEAFAAAAGFAADPANHKYQPVAGIPALLDALARKLAAENKITIGPTSGNRLMVTAGGNNAFMAALLAIADPGDEVILPVPYYFNHEMAVTMANCVPVLVPTDADYQLDLAALRAAITPRTRAIVTVSPNNPSGAVYPESALRAVNALCAERGLFHLSDEAYEQFTYDGARHFSVASIPGSAPHTISLYSMSKAFGFASWRIGWMVFPENLEAALRKIQDTLMICPPVVSQHAAVGALTAGTPFVREKLRALAEVRALVQRGRGHRENSSGRRRVLFSAPRRLAASAAGNGDAPDPGARRRGDSGQRLRPGARVPPARRLRCPAKGNRRRGHRPSRARVAVDRRPVANDESCGKQAQPDPLRSRLAVRRSPARGARPRFRAASLSRVLVRKRARCLERPA